MTGTDDLSIGTTPFLPAAATLSQILTDVSSVSYVGNFRGLLRAVSRLI
jgi:hypothetical protein